MSRRSRLCVTGPGVTAAERRGLTSAEAARRLISYGPNALPESPPMPWSRRRWFGAGLQIDESILTGESVPVERANGDEACSGTLAGRGLAWIEISRTGPTSAMGRIATMLSSVETERTPLERRLDHFGHRIARWIAALAVLLTVACVGVEGVEKFDVELQESAEARTNQS